MVEGDHEAMHQMVSNIVWMNKETIVCLHEILIIKGHLGFKSLMG